MRHHKFEPKYELKTDIPYLKDIFAICENAIRIGAQVGLVDCPSRENGVYLGDFTVIGHSNLYLTEDAKYYKKILFDFADAPCVREGIMVCANCALIQEIANLSLQYSHQVMNYYKFTGDIDIVIRLYHTVNGVLDYFAIYRRDDVLFTDVNGKWNHLKFIKY